MTDLFSALFVVALCSVLLVTGQQYLVRMPEAGATASATRLNVAVNPSPSYVR